MKFYLTLALLATLNFTLMAQTQLPTEATDISPLLIGEQFPEEGAINLDGDAVNISDLVKDKPAVVVFYRGGWCPYCNRHLAALGKIEQDILAAGYQIIAVSPDAPTQLKATLDKNDLPYTLISDGAGTLAKSAGIAFQAPDRYGERLAKVSDGANEGYLPVPSVFIINQEREILFEYINPNYKTRLSGELLLATLKAM